MAFHGGSGSIYPKPGPVAGTGDNTPSRCLSWKEQKINKCQAVGKCQWSTVKQARNWEERMFFYVGISMKAFLRRWLIKRPKGSEGSSHWAPGWGNHRCRALRQECVPWCVWRTARREAELGEDKWGVGWVEGKERAASGKALQLQEGIQILLWMKWEANGRFWTCSDFSFEKFALVPVQSTEGEGGSRAPVRRQTLSGLDLEAAQDVVRSSWRSRCISK